MRRTFDGKAILPAKSVADRFRQGVSLYTIAQERDRPLGDVEDALRRRLWTLEREHERKASKCR